MNIEEFNRNNSLHDSDILDISYNNAKRSLIVSVSQCPSEISLCKNCDDNVLVNVNIEFHNITYISYDVKQLIGYEIYDMKEGKIKDEDIIMFQLLGEDGEYLEVYVRGKDIMVNLDIVEYIHY